MYYVAAPRYERAHIAMHYIFNAGNGYWMCCYYSSPNLPGVYMLRQGCVRCRANRRASPDRQETRSHSFENKNMVRLD